MNEPKPKGVTPMVTSTRKTNPRPGYQAAEPGAPFVNAVE